MAETNTYRLEKDFLGEKQIPADAYYGIQTMRAVDNFPISGVLVHKELILALAAVKKATALANVDAQLMSREIGEAIAQAADEVIAGKFADQFIVDSIQGGAGTSINMNMNEVLANRALELLGYAKGEYKNCSPNNHVNMSQSTNDAIPTALRIAANRLAERLLVSLGMLVGGLREKAKQFDDVLKMGRTHLQDAVPIRLGQELHAYASVLQRDQDRIALAAERLLVVNIGATAVGTGLNAKQEYIDKVVAYLQQDVNKGIAGADDLVDATQNSDAYTELSAALKVCAVNITKICNDIRLMASGPKAGLSEIILPPRQPGSSIMPGKVNPVMPEVMNQIAFQVMGNDYTICVACSAGQFELNVMGPVIAFNLLQSLQIMEQGMDVFYRFAIAGMEVNRERCQEFVDQSYGIITALNPHLGYETTSQLVREAQQTGKSIKGLIIERGLLSDEVLAEILDPVQMTTPGIAGARFLNVD